MGAFDSGIGRTTRRPQAEASASAAMASARGPPERWPWALTAQVALIAGAFHVRTDSAGRIARRIDLRGQVTEPGPPSAA